MDFAMPGIDGAQTTERALALRPDLQIIALSMFGEESYYARMMEAGARGFLLKDSGDRRRDRRHRRGGGRRQLLQPPAARHAHGSHAGPRTRGDPRRAALRPRTGDSGGRLPGLSNQEIADELFISKRTVDKHRANILEKTGCKNTAALVVYAIRHGIVEL